MANIEIAVFGGINQDSDNCRPECSGCKPSSVGKREYEIMKEVLVERFGQDNLSLAYFDTLDRDFNGNAIIDQAMQSGHRFPIIFVNGVLKCSGAMPLESIAQIIAKLNEETK